MKVVKFKQFSNGAVYALQLHDNALIETTDTFLPIETKSCNYSVPSEQSSRADRWMIGVSTMSGCPVRCKFCATGSMKTCRILTAEEILDQIKFVLDKNREHTILDSKEFKINYTRMGEPFLNIKNVRNVIDTLDNLYGDKIHHYVSTIGIRGSDFSWIKGNITLQISLHSLNEERRNWLIPYKNKMTIEELGQIRTNSNLKTTINLSLVDEDDFDIVLLKKYFDPKYFFIKLSPINPNGETEKNHISEGVIRGQY